MNPSLPDFEYPNYEVVTPDDLRKELAGFHQQQAEPLGVCEDCLRPAKIPCLDGKARCALHAKQLASAILVRSARSAHCKTPKARKAKARRRAARKANR